MHTPHRLDILPAGIDGEHGTLRRERGEEACLGAVMGACVDDAAGGHLLAMEELGNNRVQERLRPLTFRGRRVV